MAHFVCHPDHFAKLMALGLQLPFLERGRRNTVLAPPPNSSPASRTCSGSHRERALKSDKTCSDSTWSCKVSEYFIALNPSGSHTHPPASAWFWELGQAATGSRVSSSLKRKGIMKGDYSLPAPLAMPAPPRSLGMFKACSSDPGPRRAKPDR